MSWAAKYIEELQTGHSVQFRPHGNSMIGKVNSGQLVTVEPLKEQILQKNDVVLVKINGNVYLHKITALDSERVQIGNNKGHINGWTSRDSVYGICTKIE